MRRDRDDKPEELGADDWQIRLAEGMEARGLSGGELARRAGFTAQYVNSLRSGERGARLPIETARRLAHAMGVSVDWLTRGEGPRERLSDVYVVGAAYDPTKRGSSYDLPAADPYPSRVETIALLRTSVAPEIIDALRAASPPGDEDPGRDYWISYAKELARDLKRIKDDPDLGAKRDEPPRSAFVPTTKKKRADRDD